MTAPPVGSGSMLVLSWFDLALASALVLVAMAISAWQRLGLVRGFAIGAVRAVVQLVAVGYVLAFLMTTREPYLILLTLLVMLVAATVTATERQKRGRAGLFLISGTAMLIGAGLTLAYVDAVVAIPKTPVDRRKGMTPFRQVLKLELEPGPYRLIARLSDDRQGILGQRAVDITLEVGTVRGGIAPPH